MDEIVRTIHTSSWAIAISASVAVAALAVGACGNGGSGGGGSGGAGSTASHSATTTSSATTSTGSDTTSASTTSGTGGMGACVEITLGALRATSGDGTASAFGSTISPDQGDTTDPDGFSLEFYGSAFDASYDGENTGTFDLSMGGDDNYATCSRCLSVLSDPSSTGKTFFTKSGTLTVDASSMQLTGNLTGTLTDLTLVEVTIDQSTFMSTPVPGGACLHIASATLTGTPPPAAWACDWSYYGDGSCDCGCGVKDSDCKDSMASSCDYCDDPGSCSTDQCPGSIDPTDNSTCTAASDAGAPGDGGSDAGP
jgi:hypothetical protein